MSVDLEGLVNQLRATLGKMEIALGGIAEAIVWTGSDGKIQWCNAAFDRLVDRPHILILSRSLSEVLPLMQATQAVAPECYPHLRLLEGDYATSEYEFPASQLAEETASPHNLMLEISGSCVAVTETDRAAVLVIRDITRMKQLEAERQQADQAQQETVAFLQATLNATADGIFLTAQDRNVPVFNQKFLQMWSMPKALLLPGMGDERLKFLSNQVRDPEAFVARIWDLFLNHPEEEAYDLVELKDGRVFERYSQPQWNGSQIVGRLWSFRDITRAKRAEAEQQQAERQIQQLLTLMRATLESMDDAVLVITAPERRTPIYNRKFLEMWSMPEELMQQTAQDAEAFQETARFQHQIEQTKDPKAFQARVWELFRDRPTETALDLIEMKDGRMIERLAQPLWNGQQTMGRVWTFRDVTETRRTEQALREREAKFRSLVENANDLIFAINAEGIFFYLSPNIQNILGFSPAEIEGGSFMPFVHPDDVHACLSAVQQVAITGQGLASIEYRARHRDGHWLWLVASLAAPQEVNGRLLIVGVARDITERKQQEEALRLIVEGTAATTSDQFFRSFVQYLARVLHARYALVTEFANQAKSAVRTLAVWHEDAIAENFEYNLQGTPCNIVFNGDVCHYPEDVQALFPEDPDLRTMGAESYLGFVLTDSSGEALGHLAVLDTKPMPHDPGKELILKIFAARASAELERKQADEALQRRAEEDRILSSISRQFVDQDEDTAINFTLRTIAQAIGSDRSCIFGFAPDQTCSYLLYEWCTAGIKPMPPAARTCELKHFPLFMQTLNGHIFQIACVAELPTDAPERRWLDNLSIQSVIVVPMIHSGQVVGCIGADVVHTSKNWSQEDINLLTRIGELIAIGQARYNAENALRVAKEAAESANRAKSTFLANMSHELRTPLNAILGFAQLMQRDAQLNPRQQSFLATINRSGEHLLELINDVLEMSKIEAGQTVMNSVPFDLLRLLQTLQDIFQIRAAAKHLSLQFEIAPDLPQYIITDEGKLRQVLINLLSNAVKFTELGGVRVRVSRVTNDLAAMTAAEPPPTYEAEQTLHFEVEDTGCGIGPDEIDSLFQPFVQTKSGMQVKEGTGLGLAISRQFVQLMGGDITLTSSVGQGSTFCFDVQVALADPADPPISLTDRPVLRLAPDQPPYRILVVDDREENLELLTQFLDRVGFETRTAINGQVAIALWQTWQPHLIWMDMRMPVMDGYEATRQIRAIEAQSSVRQCTPTKIIALTASAFEEQRATILAAGCDDLVRKPFREQIIFEKITEHLGVHYIHGEVVSAVTDNEENPLEEKATMMTIVDLQASLRAMPTAWIAALHQAALAVDADELLQLIEQIPQPHQVLADRLMEFVNQFDFDAILDLTQAFL